MDETFPRRPRRIATGQPRPLPAASASFVWAYDSAFDTGAHGRQIKCLTVVDESFSGKRCDECLSVSWFRSRTEARVVIENWRCHYDAVRPSSSPNNLTPHAFKQHHHP